MTSQSELGHLADLLKRPPIPRDFDKLLPGRAITRLNPPQMVAFVERWVDWLNRNALFPARASIEKNGWNLTVNIAIGALELPAATNGTNPDAPGA